jgi:hypothetical protein
MPQLLSEVPRLHLERARDHEQGLESAWCANYWWGGGVPGHGVGVEGAKRGKLAPMLPEMYKIV